MLRTRLMTALALLLSAGLAHAGIENAGTTAANFLSVGTGAGILAMGGATLGASRDLNAAAWNPAAAGFLTTSQYAISHAALSLDVSQDWVAGTGRLGRSDTRWAASALYQNDGTFDGRDAFGAPTGSFNVSNLALGLAVARPLGSNVTAGARFQLLNESLGQASGSGYGLDLGVQARTGRFGVGAAARNLGGRMKYDSGSYELPGVYGIGASWNDETRGLRFALDANFPHAYYNDVRFGGEWVWQQRVALRAGYRLELNAGPNEPLGGPSFGFGTGVNGLWFDYAFLAGADQSQGEHRFGLTFHPSIFKALHGPAPVAGGTQAAAPESAPVAEASAPAAKAAEKPAKAEPAAKAPLAAPVDQAASVAQAEPTAKGPSVPVASGDSGSETNARSAAPAVASLTPSKAVKVPKLVAPKVAPTPSPATSSATSPEPVAAAEPTPEAPAASVVATAPAPAASPAPAEPAASSTSPDAGPVAAVAPGSAPAEADEAPPVKAGKPAKQPKPAKGAKPAPATPAADSAAPPLAPPVAQVAATPAPRVVVVKHVSEAVKPAPKPEEPRPAQVEVKKGDTLESIAKQWGTSVPAIMMENNMVRAQVKPGQKIKLPKN